MFADYPSRDASASALSPRATALTFALGGLSKTVGLPQVKLGWIGVSGPAALVETPWSGSRRFATHICRCRRPCRWPRRICLSAAPPSARRSSSVCAQSRQLKAIAAAHPPCSVLPVEAGWYAVIQVPAIEVRRDDRSRAARAAGVLVHPGYFFDFEREAFLVVSLLPEPASFVGGVEQLFGEIGARHDPRRAAPASAFPCFRSARRRSWGIGEIGDIPAFAEWLRAALSRSCRSCR